MATAILTKALPFEQRTSDHPHDIAAFSAAKDARRLELRQKSGNLASGGAVQPRSRRL
jgi:hypothetical protein